MDIKDFILIAGGALIAAVVAHGFYIAWRNRSEPLQLNISPDLQGTLGPDDEIRRFRGELPNGGGRRVPPQQGDLLASALADVSAPDEDYEGVPVLLEADHAPHSAVDRELLGVDVPQPRARNSKSRGNTPVAEEPDLFAPSGASSPVFEQTVSEQTDSEQTDSESTQNADEHHPATTPAGGPTSRVAEVILPGTPIVAQPQQRSANEPMVTDSVEQAKSGERRQLRARRQAQPNVGVKVERQPRRLSARETTSQSRDKIAAAAADQASKAAAEPPVEKLIVLHLLAPAGAMFSGPKLVDMLRAQGLKYGAMNIFHRIEPLTKNHNYSVANAMEPGVFDLSDLENFATRGLSFFLQLPGPEDALESLEDMVYVVRTLAAELGGEVKDENMSVVTGQTVAHLRQSISDYTRKRLSRRA